MKFISTRGGFEVDNAAQAIVNGLANDGGLFVPSSFPQLGVKLEEMLGMDYYQRACEVVYSFLEEYDYNELLSACQKAYSQFDNNEPAPVVKLDENLFVMELFHGPTLAFKDIALTLLPYLLRKGADLSGKKEKILILVATSGDTGKAALEGFKNQDGISIIVFYPSDGVSDMQKAQMQTQEGNNVKVVGIKGNFDDCQNAVKQIFSNKEINQKLFEDNVILSSANSINFGRLVPQISYYFSAYCDLVNSGEIKLGDKIDFVVPTGNFGNILAGYYAKKMGLPVGKLVCASNDNNVLTEFICDGTYDINREFFKTISPSMDIIISSNLERLVFELSNRNAKLTLKRMQALKDEGIYQIDAQEKAQLNKDFYANYCVEDDCRATINYVYDELGYVADTHTAVAFNVYFDYIDQLKANKTVILSTASPFKFAQDVLYALTDKKVKDAFTACNKLSEESALEIPLQIKELENKKPIHTDVIAKSQICEVVMDFVKE